ncbi:hypothetical protein RN001_004250 [Aquatica leii]|uniref:Uncharacterized protein n=1 Tax=Aquatica leii TaxID=1421715 RepID=A0AAN7PE73_9COLE|nr:hypothetical protein RN001_004250 [Aquatica leii]
MQVLLVLSSILMLAAFTKCATINVPGTVLTLNDLSQTDRDYLEYLENQAVRQKRSGDILGAVKSKISDKLKSKLSGFASASSHASSFISGGSKGFHHYTTPHDDKNFNFWDLQKSIFHTLLQAAKAIKGGLLAIKGQLIKGSGYVISAKGKLISAKGEAITNIGKHIASSAKLAPHSHGHYSAPSGPGEAIYAEPPSHSGYGSLSGPSVEYHTHHYEHVPSAIGDKFPPTYEAYKDHHPRATNHGILIIKKIPKVKTEELKGNNGVLITPEMHKPDIESEEPFNPPFTFLPESNPSSYSNDHKDAIAPPTSYGQLPTYNSQPSQYDGPPSGFIQNSPPQYDYTPPSAQSNDLTKLEVYDPFTLPHGNQQPLTAGISNYNMQQYPTRLNGLERFPTYPVDLHKSLDVEAQYSTLVKDIILPPPNLNLANTNQFYKPHLKTKFNSRLRRIPNKNYKSVATRLKPKNI